MINANTTDRLSEKRRALIAVQSGMAQLRRFPLSIKNGTEGYQDYLTCDESGNGASE